MKPPIANWVAARGLSAIMFAASVEMMRQAVHQLDPDYIGPRGSTALIVALRLMVADSLERKP